MLVATRKVFDTPGFDHLIWTRMQSEAGQGLEQIIARKELERRAGDGLFYWGVGNAPATMMNSLARLRSPVAVVFSIMKGKPREADTSPRRVLVWRKYFDLHRVERDLPPHVLVTSRGETSTAYKKRHYALICHNAKPLKIKRGAAFDPSAYRNASGTGGPIASSQVTALLRRVSPPSAETAYEANFTAQLTGSYWVRLSDPAILWDHHLDILRNVAIDDQRRWVNIVTELRGASPVVPPEERQRLLF
jgi:hypothetical protein